ncbi:unnamed protein product [Amoebophrya sp. A120]|nr:unnamed protein product [Amoebophrya sp. A120]|eukprot:GSA120T00023488001.1
MQSHYLVLGVPRKATQDVIKKAYRELAKKYHPDRNAGHTAAGLFQKVQEAYDVLSDEKRRKEYDQTAPGTSSSSSSSSSSTDPTKGRPVEGSWMDPNAARNRNPNVELAKKLRLKKEYYEKHGSGRYVNPVTGQTSDEHLAQSGFLWRYTFYCRQMLLVVPFFVLPVSLLGFVFCTCIDHSMTGLTKKKSGKNRILYDEHGKAYCRDAQGVYRKLSSALDIAD